MKTNVSAQAKTKIQCRLMREAGYVGTKRLFASFALIMLAAAPVLAATKTVTLSVPGMTCAACPITVKKALTKVDGVQTVEVSYEQRTAVVTFDDTRTNLQALTRATENTGYPASEVR